MLGNVEVKCRRRIFFIEVCFVCSIKRNFNIIGKSAPLAKIFTEHFELLVLTCSLVDHPTTGHLNFHSWRKFCKTFLWLTTMPYSAQKELRGSGECENQIHKLFFGVLYQIVLMGVNYLKWRVVFLKYVLLEEKYKTKWFHWIQRYMK